MTKKEKVTTGPTPEERLEEVARLIRVEIDHVFESEPADTHLYRLKRCSRDDRRELELSLAMNMMHSARTALYYASQNKETPKRTLARLEAAEAKAVAAVKKLEAEELAAIKKVSGAVAELLEYLEDEQKRRELRLQKKLLPLVRAVAATGVPLNYYEREILERADAFTKRPEASK